MSKVIDLFLEYVRLDTQSTEESNTTPSTLKQHMLAKLLVKQLTDMGAAEITYDEAHCYVYASFPPHGSLKTRLCWDLSPIWIHHLPYRAQV